MKSIGIFLAGVVAGAWLLMIIAIKCAPPTFVPPCTNRNQIVEAVR